MGTLDSGNHYLEVQEVAEVFDGDVAVAVGLGHQIGTEFLREMAIAVERYGIELPDRELAFAPIRSELGARYLGAMRAAINCALAKCRPPDEPPPGGAGLGRPHSDRRTGRRRHQGGAARSADLHQGLMIP
jgi:hypothetical protein